MKKCTTVLLFLFFAFCIATTSYTAETQKVQSSDFKLQQASKVLQITGSVKSLNEVANSITVTKKFKDKIIEVTAITDKETKITKGNELKSLRDINAGDRVVVIYNKKGELNLAKSIFLK
jgi:hypothetical protein